MVSTKSLQRVSKTARKMQGWWSDGKRERERERKRERERERKRERVEQSRDGVTVTKDQQRRILDHLTTDVWKEQ